MTKRLGEIRWIAGNIDEVSSSKPKEDMNFLLSEIDRLMKENEELKKAMPKLEDLQKRIDECDKEIKKNEARLILADETLEKIK